MQIEAELKNILDGIDRIKKRMLAVDISYQATNRIGFQENVETVVCYDSSGFLIVRMKNGHSQRWDCSFL